jgi:plastocyanin
MRGTRRGRLLVAAAVLMLVVAACGGDDDGGEGGDGTGGTGATTGPTEGTGGGGTTITIAGFAFDPATLTVSGETTLTITNDDTATHTFTLDDGSVDEEIPGGETVEVSLNLSERTGFHCAIHPQMTGTLEVA